MDRKTLDPPLHRIFDSARLPLAEARGLLDAGVHPDQIARPADKWPLLTVMSELPSAWWDNGQAGDFAVLYRELIARGASVNKTIRGRKTSFTLLNHAAAFNSLLGASLLECLLDAGADPGTSNEPPICRLIGFGSMKGEIFGLPFDHAPGSPEYDAFWSALQRLLHAGADINAFERRGLYNPLLMAAICGADHAMQRLIALGADPAVVNKDGTTALMYAAGDADGLSSIVAGISCAWSRRGDTLAATRLLLEHGLDPALANTRKRTALGIALRNGCVDVAYLLAQALAAKGALARKELSGFQGTPFEAQALALPADKPVKKSAVAKDTSGAAQLATWARLPNPAGAQVFAKESALVAGLMALDIRKQLYVEHDDHGGGSLRLSTNRNWLTRKGCIDIRTVTHYAPHDAHAMPKTSRTRRFVVRHEALNADSTNTELRAALEIPTDASGQPEAAALKDALLELLRDQLGVSATQ